MNHPDEPIRKKKSPTDKTDTVPQFAAEDAMTRPDVVTPTRTSVRGKTMPTLIVLKGAQADTRYRLDKAEMWIGRGPTCDISILDGQASRRHAVIEYQNFGAQNEEPVCVIRDNGSTNGTYLNGKRVREARLQDRDRLKIGHTVIAYGIRDTIELDAESRLYYRATCDALTGLRNRHALDSILALEFSRARRYGRPMSVVMLDVDHFKKVNDTHGHAVGDACLKRLAWIIQQYVREQDMVCRYGGEEIAVVCPETDADGVVILSERLRTAVENLPFKVEGRSLNLTISLGAATLTSDVSGGEALMKRADKALYVAKEAGRNRVETYK